MSIPAYAVPRDVLDHLPGVVLLNPCHQCKGKGYVQQDATFRRAKVLGICPTCRGERTRKAVISLAELAELLQQQETKLCSDA